MAKRQTKSAAKADGGDTTNAGGAKARGGAGGDGTKAIRTIADLTPDDRNCNRGTERGLGLLERSLRSYGAGRSILTDKTGRVIAGNKTLEQAAAIGLDEVIVVPTDGRKLVVVQRTDLDLDDPAARELAIADNRVGELDLQWDPDQLRELEGAGVDLAGVGFSEGELREIEQAATVAGLDESTGGAAGSGFEAMGRNRGVSVAIVLQVTKSAVVEHALLETGIVSRGDALVAICEHYVRTKGQLDAAAQGGPAKAGD